MSRKSSKRLLNFRPVEETLIWKEKSTGNEFSSRLPSNYSPPNPTVQGSTVRDISSISFDYQLTVCPKVELTRYQCSMLLETLEVSVIEYGISFSTYLCLEYLYSRLLGDNKVLEIRNENERRVVFLAQILLRSIEGSWYSLDERECLKPDTERRLREITDLFPSLREFRSRVEYWNCERFLKVQAVRLDVFLDRRENSERYSSYCKGYGESSSTGRRKKTRPSAELDGESTDRPEVYISTVSELKMLLDLVNADLFEQEAKKRKRR